MLNNKIIVFLKSLFFHISLGLPKCNQKEIDHRHQVCTQCASYDKNFSICLECQCNISNKSIFMNKLAWADQECPLNKWSKIDKT
jgi:hypothetical protein